MTEEIKITNPYTERKMIPTGLEMMEGPEANSAIMDVVTFVSF